MIIFRIKKKYKHIIERLNGVGDASFETRRLTSIKLKKSELAAGRAACSDLVKEAAV